MPQSNGKSNGTPVGSGAGKAGVPDGGWGWVVVGGSTLIHFLVVGMGRSFGVFYLDLLDRFQMSSSATSWVVAIYNTMRMAFGPLAGMLCDRFTCKRVVLCGGLVASVGCIITAFATSLTYTYFSFGLVTGIGASFLFTPSYVIVGKYFDKNKGKAMAISTMGAGLGTVGLAPLIQLLLDTYSFFGAMLILGALMLHNCFAGILFRPLPKPAPVEREMQDLSPTANGGGEVGEEEGNPHGETPGETPPAGSPLWGTVRRQLSVLANVTFLMYGVQILCMSICIQVFLSFLPAIAEQYGADRRPAALLLSVMGFADMAGRFLWGFFFDLKTIRHRRRLFHTLLGFPLAGMVFITGFMDTYWAFFAMTIAFGLVEGGFHSQRATIVSEFVAKDQLSSTVGFVIFFQGFGNMAGPPVAGMLRDMYHTYNVCYFFGGIALCVSSLLFLIEYFVQKMLARRRRQSQPVTHVDA